MVAAELNMMIVATKLLVIVKLIIIVIELLIVVKLITQMILVFGGIEVDLIQMTRYRRPLMLFEVAVSTLMVMPTDRQALVVFIRIARILLLARPALDCSLQLFAILYADRQLLDQIIGDQFIVA